VRKKFWPVGGGSVLTGSGGVGARRGGRRVEAEREREREREGALARAWAARCRVTVENSGVGATRVDVADRWAGALWGPGHQRLGAARGSTVRRLRSADRWGRQHSAPDSVFKLNQIYLKRIQICPKL
jgi:hypothetical protein